MGTLAAIFHGEHEMIVSEPNAERRASYPLVMNRSFTKACFRMNDNKPAASQIRGILIRYHAINRIFNRRRQFCDRSSRLAHLERHSPADQDVRT